MSLRKDLGGSNLGKQVHQIRDRPVIELLHSLNDPASEIFIGENRVLLARYASAAHVYPMLTDEEPGPEQIEALRAMSGQERLRTAERLYWSARKMKAAGLRAQHPDWPEARVEADVRRIFANARS